MATTMTTGKSVCIDCNDEIKDGVLCNDCVTVEARIHETDLLPAFGTSICAMVLLTVVTLIGISILL
jgi:hypothetical protein